jgi:hypothetical protein
MMSAEDHKSEWKMFPSAVSIAGFIAAVLLFLAALRCMVGPAKGRAMERARKRIFVFVVVAIVILSCLPYL